MGATNPFITEYTPAYVYQYSTLDIFIYIHIESLKVALKSVLNERPYLCFIIQHY